MTRRADAPTRATWTSILGLGAAALLATGMSQDVHAAPKAAGHTAAACSGDNGGIELPPGFCATIFADDLGHVRHMAVASNGVVYANTWSGRYFPGGATPPGGFLIALQDTDRDGKADLTPRFGESVADGAAGGSGVAVYRNAVYAEVNDKIVRYALIPGTIAPAGKPEVVLSGLPLTGDHPMHPFVIDAKGQIFVDLGSATNSCQPKNRMTGVPGADPCVELETRGGIWRYDANKVGQTFSPAGRYATGIRNGEGMGFDSAGRMFVTQHGRDQLLQNWPALYPDAVKATELPAEEVVELKQGGDYGWPTCYFDAAQNKLVLAPEYGGDGGKTVGSCAKKLPPVAAFPAHWAPNDLTIYTAQAFPAAYRNGAFIAFHGSWNRAPAPQGGFNVVFQPLRDGKAAGPYVVFADGFAGPGKAQGKAAFKPTGLAVAPDGALYISDDVKGRIWRVTYHGAATAPVAAAVTHKSNPNTSPQVMPAKSAALPTPPGATAAQVELGGRIFRGEAAGGACGGCHGADAKGTALGPDLTAGTWMWGDGSLASITDVIAKGVPTPKRYRSPMPAMGGSQLSPSDLAAVSAYVWAAGHKTQP
jgi:glucose/arabinose dehydrogenase/mono/diheme cytochrome c family protein